MDWVPPRTGRAEGVVFVYDGGILDAAQTDASRLPPQELRSGTWSTLARRVAAAVEAAAGGGTVYLEDGNRIC